MIRKRQYQMPWGGGETSHFGKPPLHAGRTVSVFAALFLLAGCAGMQDWMPDLVGGEGKMAERVSASIIDEPPAEIAPAKPASEPALDALPDAVPSAVPSAVPEAAPITPGAPREQVLAIQRDLAELGYHPGPADGVVGALTTDAIVAFQKDSGMKADGKVTRELADRLAAAPKPEKPEVAVPADVPPDATSESAPESDSRPVAETAMVQAPKSAPEPGAKPAEKPIIVKDADVAPQSDPGDTYIWSNGRVETVAGLAGSKLLWRVDNGVRFTADRNFLIPPASWSGPSGTGEAITQVDTALSWPVTAQSPLAFEVVNNGIHEEWRCAAGGGRRVSVAAGQFDAVSLSCERNSAPGGEWVRREWFYAPSVRYYVKRIDYFSDGTRASKELLGVRPGAEDWPPAARAGLDRAVQDALDSVPAGEKSVWTSTVVRGEFEIQPGPVRTLDGETHCRNFELVAETTGASRRYPALACKSGDSPEWHIPGDTSDRPGIVSVLPNAG